MRKVDDKKKEKKTKKKIMSFLVATNVIASLPPKRQSIGIMFFRPPDKNFEFCRQRGITGSE